MQELVEGLRLIDHHCHGVSSDSSTPTAFQMRLTEAHQAMRDGATYFDTPLGIALRRACAPVIDLPRHAEPDEYLARRRELGPNEVARRFLTDAGLQALLVDTGFAGEETSPADLGRLAGCGAYTVYRIETIAEAVLAQHDRSDFRDALRVALETAARTGVSFKSIVAYRAGLDFTPEAPTPAELAEAVEQYADQGTGLTSPVILRQVLYETLSVAAPMGMPIQFHTGYGDNDLDLWSANPIHLTPFIRDAERLGVPIVLLHCYPYHREGAYLAAAFPNVYFDIGLTIPHVGLGAERILAESLEVAPFAKLLYSSDAALVPEFFYLASRLFREAAAAVFGKWVSGGLMSATDAERFVKMIGSENARAVYPALGEHRGT